MKLVILLVCVRDAGLAAVEPPTKQRDLTSCRKSTSTSTGQSNPKAQE